MIKTPKAVSLTLLFTFCCFTLGYSQQSVVSAGIDGSGTIGTMSGSTGLPDFYYYATEHGSLSFGVQHAPQTNLITITAVPVPLSGGSVTGAGQFLYGDIVTLVAIANTGNAFLSWTENGEIISVEPVLSFTAETDRELEANFAVNVPLQKSSVFLSFILIILFIWLRKLYVLK